MLYQITDWDDAYQNAAHIPQGDAYPPQWQARADAFRAGHPAAVIAPTAPEGDPAAHLPRADRAGLLFRPARGAAQGLLVFIHGGYWTRFAPPLWSHLAAGALARGWAVLMPGYTLAPQARLSRMPAQIAPQITHAARHVAGPIVLSGHSAGGHLAARLICAGTALPGDVAARVRRCVPISGLFDLRPLLRLTLNRDLQLDPAEAAAESPALLEPLPGIPVTTWVGGAERPEFLRQSRLLATIWPGMGAATECVIDPGRHHFDVIEALAYPDTPLTRQLLA